MSSLSLPGNSAAEGPSRHSLSPPDSGKAPADVARVVVTGAALAPLRQRQLVARSTDAGLDAMLQPPPRIHVRFTSEGDDAAHETIAFQDLLHDVTSPRRHSGKSGIEVFHSVLRVMRSLPLEECRPLLDAVEKWRSQSPEVMHANIQHALAECPQLTQPAQRALLSVILSWNLAGLDEKTLADDYADIATAINRSAAGDADAFLDGLALLGRLASQRGQGAAEGIVRGLTNEPRATPLSLGAA
jgi:hypothetical protein